MLYFQKMNSILITICATLDVQEDDYPKLIKTCLDKLQVELQDNSLKISNLQSSMYIEKATDVYIHTVYSPENIPVNLLDAHVALVICEKQSFYQMRPLPKIIQTSGKIQESRLEEEKKRLLPKDSSLVCSFTVNYLCDYQNCSFRSQEFDDHFTVVKCTECQKTFDICMSCVKHVSNSIIDNCSLHARLQNL